MTVEFSVLTPTYNCADYIRRAYWCLCQQTVQDWEWVIVDDGSTDETQMVLSSLRDPRIRVVRNQTNRGRGPSRNRGLQEVGGDWLVLWDMDDMSFPDRLAAARRARAAGDDFMCSAALLVDSELQVTGIRGFECASYPRNFVHASLCVDVTLAKKIGYTAHKTGEDYSMMITLANGYRGRFVSEPLYVYFEDRELSARKAFATHGSRVKQVEALIEQGVLRPTWRLRKAVLASRCKQAAALLLWSQPGLYQRTLRFRSANRRFVLSDDQHAFLKTARERPWETQSISASPQRT